MRLLILSLVLPVFASGCGRSGLAGKATSPEADGAVPPAACSSLVSLGSAELGPPGKDSHAPSIAGRGGLLGVSWTTTRKPGTNDLELRFATFGAGLKPSPTAGAVVSSAIPGAPAALAVGPQEWAALFMRGSTTGSMVPKLVLARFDGAGKPLGPTLEITAQAMAQALAARGKGGYGMIYTHPSKVGTINFRAMDSAGKTGAARRVVTGDSYNDLWLSERSDGGFLAGWWGKHYMLARLAQDGRMLAFPAVVAQRSGPWAARYVLVSPDRVGILYLQQATNPGKVDLMFRIVQAMGSGLGPERKVASGVGAGDAPMALAWSGKRFVVVYDAKRADLRLSARLLNRDGAPVGGAVAVAGCLLTSSRPATAWAGDTVGVAMQAGLSGLPTQRACLAALRCK